MTLKLLEVAYLELRKLFPNAITERILKDHVGKFALVVKIGGGHYPLCAKRSMKGGIVSVDKEIFDSAKSLDSKIVIYMSDKQKGRFYVYAWRDIEQCPNKFENMRYDKLMINFPIGLGINLLRLLDTSSSSQGKNITTNQRAQDGTTTNRDTDSPDSVRTSLDPGNGNSSATVSPTQQG